MVKQECLFIPDIFLLLNIKAKRKKRKNVSMPRRGLFLVGALEGADYSSC